ncbi:FHA domain-containing protein [Planctomycetota bacterium]|nr:FHA domain-containing protein [Planctomycetota bacterium]
MPFVAQDTLENFRMRASSEPEAQFMEHCPRDVLVIREVVSEQDSEGFLTQRGAGRRMPGLDWVVALQKREGANPFSHMVTIGRAENNDVILQSSSVSKFHAYLTEVDGERFIADAGSSLGTFLGPERLVPRKAVKLPRGETLRLGESLVTYCTAADLLDRLLSGRPVLATAGQG